MCNCIIFNHRPALVKHMTTSKHKQIVNSISNTPLIEKSFKPKKEELKNRAELKLCAFIAQHNLLLSLLDHMIPILVKTFLDSATLKTVSLGRTKTTNTIIIVLGPMTTQQLASKLKATSFSIIMDETTDISVKKQCALAVNFCDEDDRVLDMYEAKSGKAEDLTNGLQTWLENEQIPLKCFVGFASDTTNSMVGPHNSVFSHLKE